MKLCFIISLTPTLLSLSFLTLSPDQAREQFKARVNEVAYIKADSKVSDGHCVCGAVGGWLGISDRLIVCECSSPHSSGSQGQGDDAFL